jgi:hypothetical protein
VLLVYVTYKIARLIDSVNAKIKAEPA